MVKQLFQKATGKKVIFVDYDGTLTATQKHPEFAHPSKTVLKILNTLSFMKDTYVYILSGRTRKFLDHWFGTMAIGLCAEHGCFYRHPLPLEATTTATAAATTTTTTTITTMAHDVEGKLASSKHDWVSLVDPIDMSWRDTIMPLFQHHRERTPGSDIEEKEVCFENTYREGGLILDLECGLLLNPVGYD
jgi:trehalose 6-phosphate synthase/phosphatase